jgi:hypothetical protein
VFIYWPLGFEGLIQCNIVAITLNIFQHDWVIFRADVDQKSIIIIIIIIIIIVVIMQRFTVEYKIN